MRLAVNIDHIATLRNARREKEPDPVQAAILAELAGAEGIVCHLREDRRHIQDRDLAALRATVKSKLDLEMAMTEEMLRIAINTKPDLVTLVPENRAELTTEGGLNVSKMQDSLKPFIKALKAQGIPTSLFIEPDIKAVELSKAVGADFIEIHTGKYASLKSDRLIENELKTIQSAVTAAKNLGLRVNAGHGLNYHNIQAFAKLRGIEEVSIGHSLIARAALVGIEQAVRDMISLIYQNKHS
ncbi:MAG: pyridoxine 5'-phosphate synthase [Chloroherpetonaceae bacterium]|nr:pyridoxine 5'-phosphate synthase [Chloroherpetonaceae bacterium]